MKKILLGLSAFIMMFAASCEQQEFTPNLETEATVSFNVATPQIAVKSYSYSDGTTATQLQYAVYAEDGTYLETLTGSATIINGSATVKLPLVTGNKYSVIFWADHQEAPYTVDFRAKTMTVDYTAVTSNNEKLDAFYKYHTFTVSGAQTESIELTRPFAQLNIGTADYAASASAGYTPTQSSVTIKNLQNTLNFADGTVDGDGDEDEVAVAVTFGSADIPSGETFPVAGYEYLAMNYFLVGADKEVVDVEFTYTDGNKAKTRTVGSVPVQRNYRTNIYGNILTSEVDINVEIKPEYETPDNLVYVWDGTEMTEPQVSEDNDNIYEIEYASELAWLQAAVNGTLETAARTTVEAQDFKGKTFVLTQDIDLGGKEWTPIGSSSHIFKGTFDGQGHTVKNLKVSGYNSNVGLFGVTHDGEIKNLTVENAEVSGRLNVGVVAGQPYTSKYTNITVKGHVEVNGMAYVGAVGGKNAYADWTDITVNADETSYVKAHSIENGSAYRTYVGGVCGFNGEGGHKFSNITSNIDVKGSTCDVGGLFGIAHYGNQFVNCKCTGDVEIYAAEEAEDAQEIGGIAGVWHNETGYSVTMTGCEFTGTLTTNIEGVAYYYNGLVGKPYGNGEGKLTINGKQYVATAAQLQAAINAADGETTLYLGYDIVRDVTVVQKQGVKITIEGENKKFNGSIKVHSNSNYYADAALTIKNVNFETSTPSINFIEALENGSERYSSNITVENCTFTATGDAVNTSVAVQVKATRGVTVTGCTATDMHSLIQAQSCDTGDVKVINSTVNGKNGVAFKQVKSATVEGTTITALEYGIRFDGNIDNYGIVVKNNNVTANQPLIVRKMTGKDNTITLEGENKLTPPETSAYQIIITNGSDDEAYVKPTGTYTLTAADSYSVYPRDYYFPVATWDEFTAALAAGEDQIKLTADISTSASYTLTKDLKLELDGNAFAIDNATACLNIGDKNNTTKPNVTIKGGNLNCMVYGLSGNVTIKDVVFGGTFAYVDAYQGVVNTKYANLLMENCKMTNVKKSGSKKPRTISVEGRTSGYIRLIDCDLSKSGVLDRAYFWSIGGTTILELKNCVLYTTTLASNIDFSGTYSLCNVDLADCKGGFTFGMNRASTSLTDEEMAVYKAIKKNNSGSMRFIFTDGEKNNL